MTKKKNHDTPFRGDIDEVRERIDETVVHERVLPTIPLTFTSRGGETKQIGTAVLQEDATIICTVYAGSEGVLPVLFSMEGIFFSVDANTRLK